MNVDSKGRVIIPQRYKDLLGEDFVMTMGLDSNLLLYPKETWENLIEDLEEFYDINAKAAKYYDWITGSCEEDLNVDKLGRTTIMKKFRDLLGMDKEVVFVGNRDKLSLYSKEKYEEYLNRESSTMEDNYTEVTRLRKEKRDKLSE
jgi:MraZ protein